MAATCKRSGCSLRLVKCSHCDGKGYWFHLLIENPCSKCKKTGWICPDHGGNWQ